MIETIYRVLVQFETATVEKDDLVFAQADKIHPSVEFFKGNSVMPPSIKLDCATRFEAIKAEADIMNIILLNKGTIE